MKLAVISDGISKDPETACRVAAEYGLEYIDFQFLDDGEIGDQDDESVQKLKKILKKYGVKLHCLTRHNFAGLPCKMDSVGSEAYKQHFVKYKRCFEIANELEAPLVRLMSGKKDMILFGYNGAEQWVTASGAWDAQVEIFREPVAYAEKMGTTIVTENCNGGQITSNILAAKLSKSLEAIILKSSGTPVMPCTVQKNLILKVTATAENTSAISILKMQSWI